MAKETIRRWLNQLGEAAPWLARFFLFVVYPFPRLYLFVAHSARLVQIATKRIWHIQSGPLAGFKLTNLLPAEIWPVLTNSMEIRCSNLLGRLPLKSRMVLDVGSSYGYYSLLLSRLVGWKGRVYSFEPDWRSFERLTHNLAINDGKNVIAVPICASNSSTGLAKWHSLDDEPWNSRLADNLPDIDSPELIAVPVTTLDDFVDMLGISERVRLVKIDVEGAELKVLEGAIRLLRRSKPLILCELHGLDIAQQVLGFLSGLGYEWEMVEYISDTRQHILAFASDQANVYRTLISQ